MNELHFTQRRSTLATYELEKIRADFPILRQFAYGKPLVYLDSAATTQKPQVVINAECEYYKSNNASVHRGIHQLSERATQQYEAARTRVQQFINAAASHEIIFTRGTTEAINLVAGSFGRATVGKGDEILITAMEHHSNIVPWQILCTEKGARLRVAPISDAGELILEEFEQLLNGRTRMVSVVHTSNTLGTVNPVREIVGMVHRRGVPILLDGAQAAPHLRIDVRELDCDFYAFSAHKLYGPTGIGVLYGKSELLHAMPPYQSGGNMIHSVSFDKTVYNELPYKFEAGTPNIAGAIGLRAAIDYMEHCGMEAIAAHELSLQTYAAGRLQAIPGIRLIGAARERAAALSFVMDDIHPHDIGTILDRQGIAIRTGHHCTQPLMDRFNGSSFFRLAGDQL